METWALGWLLALCIGVYKVGLAAASANNQTARNMRKIGAHYSLFGSVYTAKSAPRMEGYFWFGAYQLLVGPLFSWIAVISSTIAFFLVWRAKFGLPEKLREITYRLRHVELSEEQMLELDARELPQKQLDLKFVFG